MTNQRTGEARDFISNDGGKSWQMDDTSKGDVALDQRIAAAGPEDTSAISPITPPQAQEPAPPISPAPAPVRPQQMEPLSALAQAQPDAGGWGAYGQAMGSTATGVDDVGGSLRAAATGASMGQNRRSAALGAELASAFGPSDPLGYEREYPAGSESGDIESSEKRANDQAVAAHPGWHAVGSAAPIMATAELGGGAGLGTLARAAVNAGVAGTVSGLQSVGESDAATPQDAWARFSEGSKAPAVVAAGMTGLGGLVGAGAEWAGKYTPEASRYMRGVAARVGDLPENQRDALIKTVGDKPEQAIGGAIDRLGLTRTSKGPMSGTGYARAAGDMASELGDEYGAMLDRNSQAGVEMPKAELVQQLRGLRSKYKGTMGDNARAMSRKADRAISDLESGPYANQDSLTVSDLHDIKKIYENEGGFKPGEAQATQPIAAAKSASRDIASNARAGLADTMDQMALREDVPRFHELKSDIGMLNTIRGVALGTEGRTDLAGSVARAAHSPTMALIHMGKDYGADVAATGLKGAGVGLNAMGALNTAAANPAYRAIPQMSALAMGHSPNRGLPRPVPAPSMQPLPPVPASQPISGPGQRPQNAATSLKGHEQVGVLKQRMQQAPAAFGKYAPQLQAALESEHPDEEFATVVHQLAVTDPTFRLHYLRGEAP